MTDKELADPRLQRGLAATGKKGIGIALLNLVEDINEGRVNAQELFFSPAKTVEQRTSIASGNWVVTIKGSGTGIPAVVDDEPEEEFTGVLF